MSGKCLLDTNIVIALFGADPSVHKQLGDVTEVFIPSIVIGELYYGAYCSSRVINNLARIDEFTASNAIISCDTDTAKSYGAIKSLLRRQGKPIPRMISGSQLWLSSIS